jgi:hypothetical protein
VTVKLESFSLTSLVFSLFLTLQTSFESLGPLDSNDLSRTGAVSLIILLHLATLQSPHPNLHRLPTMPSQVIDPLQQDPGLLCHLPQISLRPGRVALFKGEEDERGFLGTKGW